MLFGPEEMSGSSAAHGASLYYPATFMFTPCAAPLPEPVGTHQSFCEEGGGASWVLLYSSRWRAVPAPGDACRQALEGMCSQGSQSSCGVCAGQHQLELRQANCTAEAVAAYCSADLTSMEAALALRERAVAIAERELAVAGRELAVRERALELRERDLRLHSIRDSKTDAAIEEAFRPAPTLKSE